MIYHFLYPLREIFSPFNVLRYITFRTAAGFITAIVINFIVAPKIIKWLKKKDKNQVINDDGPSSHRKKEGTPTMGGLIIILSLTVSTVLWANIKNPYIIILLASTLWLGLIGFIDDYISSSSKRAIGLTPALKLAGQVVLGLSLAAYLYFNPSFSQQPHSLTMPFFKDLYLNLGSGYIIMVLLTVVATSNAVNITDGLDGLAIGCIIFASLTYMVLAYIAGHAQFSSYLFVPNVPSAGEMSIFLAALAGAGLGFLWFNIFPAKVFMGDTASLFMGAVIGISAIIIRQEVLLILVGGVFLMEIMSVVLQVLSFRYTGKRIFKMAPLHHHFELKGWSEPQIVIRFWIIAIILSMFTLSTLKIR